MKATYSQISSISTFVIPFSLICFLVAATFSPLMADEIPLGAESMTVEHWPKDRPVRAQFVHRPAKHSPEWEHYRALELYYDDLEDHYRWRDRRLSNYYERFEGYYEDLRKGRPAIYPDVQPHHIFPHGESHRSAMPRMVPHRTAAIPQVQPLSSPYSAEPKIQSPLPPSTATQSEPQNELERSYRELLTQLSGLTTGNRWREYLKLPVRQQALGFREKLEEAAARYDRISSNPDYEVVAQLPAFESTRNLLHEKIVSFEAGPTLAEPGPTLAGPELVPAEELPLPSPSSTTE